MRTLEILLERRWILKSRDRELYYQIRDELGSVKKFLTEKLGYQVVVNPYLIKVEKMPAKPENWMGIQEFTDPIEYVFFCMVLMFLEEKEAEEQFVLSELTEFIEGQYREEQIDWTVYRYRRHLIKVMKYCAGCGILDINDGSEENFARNNSSEVLYENTGVSRYFMKNFTQDIMGYTSPADFEREEWIDVNEDRGIIRRQRVYRRLLMSMGMEKDRDTEEDFAYLRNFRNMIQGELSELFDCELHVHRNSAFLILGEGCRMGRCFPEENTLSDIVLLVHSVIQEKIQRNELVLGAEERLVVPGEYFTGILEECRERYSRGFIKTYREMTTREFCQQVKAYMTELALIEEESGSVRIHTAVGKIAGQYPKDFLKNGGENEQ
ncbi:MAG TPA: TIGR02678 family protein [Candidatus Blautia faecipullorum]|nr:TIGR02678 family protein [Candidatus Blautia faecipullorum]